MPEIPTTMRASVLVDARGRSRCRSGRCPGPVPTRCSSRCAPWGCAARTCTTTRRAASATTSSTEPLVLGHEVSGVIVDVGAGVPRGAGRRAGGGRAAAPVPALPRVQDRPATTCARRCSSSRPRRSTAPSATTWSPRPTSPTPVPDDALRPRRRPARAVLGRALGLHTRPNVEPGLAGVDHRRRPIGALAALAARSYGRDRRSSSPTSCAARRERILDFGATRAVDPARRRLRRCRRSRSTPSSSAPAPPRPLLSGLDALREAAGPRSSSGSAPSEIVAARPARSRCRELDADRRVPLRRHLARRRSRRRSSRAPTSTAWSPRSSTWRTPRRPSTATRTRPA